MSFYIDCKSGTLILTDPSYQKHISTDTSLSFPLSFLLPESKVGKWFSILTEENIFNLGLRVKHIRFYHEHNLDDFQIKKSHEIIVPVDSGQLSLFDSSKYPSNSDEHTKLYERCCEISFDNNYGYIDDIGFVTRTGVGDGYYNAVINKDENDKTISIFVSFVNENYNRYKTRSLTE